MFLAQDLDDFNHHIPPAGPTIRQKIHTPELCALSWIKWIGAASYPSATSRGGHAACSAERPLPPAGGMLRCVPMI